MGSHTLHTVKGVLHNSACIGLSLVHPYTVNLVYVCQCIILLLLSETVRVAPNHPKIIVEILTNLSPFQSSSFF